VPIYEYACECGYRFEALVKGVDSLAPACPCCGGLPRRRPASRVALIGRATLPPGREQAPRSWEETNGGDRETILHWQRTLEQRSKVEEKYPELAADSRPVLAHEGPYAASPLRGHGHGHPHGHGLPAPAEAESRAGRRL
jgi:putative FmdB family regulatory protein